MTRRRPRAKTTGAAPTPPNAAVLRAAVDAYPTGCLMVDAAGRIVLANAELERILGFEAGELIGHTLEELVPPQVRVVHQHHEAEFRTDPHARRMGTGRELRARHKDGHEIPVEIGLAPVVSGDERYVIAAVVDVTARRAAEARLRWLSLAVEQSPNSVVITDLQGNIEYVNPRFTEVTGFTFDEVRGKTPRLLKSGQTPPQVYEDLWSTVRAGRLWKGELLNRRKDGTTYWDAMWVYPIRDASGQVSHFLALKEDITERRRAEESLRGSEAYHRAVLENFGDAVFIADIDGRFVDSNPQACTMTGYTREELLQLRVADTCLPEDRAEAVRRVRSVVAGSAVVIERALLRKDGSVVIVESNTRSLGGDRMLATVRDITERRNLEQQLRQAQKMEAIGRLAGGVAHDFNNVLTAIFGYVELMGEDLPPDHPMRQDLDEVRKAAHRAAGLTRQLLAFSRQQVLQPVVLDLNDMVEDLDKMLRRVIGEDVNLALALASDLGNVRADLGQIQQVVMNLVVNARDAMPTGGRLLIETANVHLTEGYAEEHYPVMPGSFVMLAVTDTGTGMSPETKARVFEPFFTTKERGKGTGLGLSTVYGIVKQSGGYIWVYSEIGQGTAFKIYLPRVEAAVDEIGPTSEDVRSLSGTETILLAEDDEMLRPLSKTLLEKLGYTVLDAPNAADAFAAAMGHPGPIHLLVSDVVMPGGSGRDLARRLAVVRPDTKVLYVSGYTDDAIVRHGMLEPGLNFLQKPFTPAALARKVREVLGAT